MAKDRNQKLKILYIARILAEQSDEEHPVNTEEIIRQLKQRGITAECKSIYSDIEALIGFGLDIVCKRGRNGGYYLLSRPFELAELRLLVDAVHSSRFITRRKSAQLADKLGGLVSRYQAEQLGRDVYVPNRIRTMNESVYYNIDEINTAILTDRQITFDYFDYNVNKEKVYRRNGERYQVSPYTLMWNDEKYYLIAYDEQKSAIRHFRVDKMERIEREDHLREGGDVFAALNLADYSAALFGMFGGELSTVTLRVRAALAGVMIDRFGRDVLIVNQNDGWFLMQASVELSPQFYGWLFGFGTDIELIAPERVRKMYASRLRAVAGQYQAE